MTEGLFHPLESSTREEGRRRFLALLPKIETRLDPRTPDHLSTMEGLKLMHRITTYGSDKAWPEEVISGVAIKVATANNSYVQTNQDMNAVVNAVVTKLRVLKRKARQKDPETSEEQRVWRGTHDIKFASSILGGRSAPVRFTLDMRRRGTFRMLGRRTETNGSITKVPALHVVEVFDRFEDSGGKEVEFYLGALDSVEDLVERLCDWRDRELPKARNLDEYLRAIVYFSIIGAKVIHPFFDGNGRAFEAQVIKDLRAIGYPIERMPHLDESENLAQNALEGASNEFLFQFLENHIPLIPGSRLVDIENNEELSARYTHALSTAIRARLMSGMPHSGTLFQIIEAGVAAIKMSLSRDVGKATKEERQWGPNSNSAFYVGPEYYEKEIVDLREVIKQRGEPVRRRE